MPEKGGLRLIQGGASGEAKARYYATGIVNDRGEHIVRTDDPGGAPPGDGSMKLTLPDLRWNVAILNGLAALFTVGMVGMFLWMVDRIDDKFEALQAPVQATAQAVAAQGETLKGIGDRITDLRTEIRNADQPERGAGEGAGEPVREGTRDRPDRQR